jgi:hypothetical protein
MPAPIVDKEEKLIRGYKNIPSLNAITERMRRTKLDQQQKNEGKEATTIVVTGPENVVTTPTSEPVPTAAKEEQKDEEHPLQHTWYAILSRPLD